MIVAADMFPFPRPGTKYPHLPQLAETNPLRPADADGVYLLYDRSGLLFRSPIP
jgi:hypothetical protein